MRWLRAWHAVLVLPAWLAAITVLGAAAHRVCIEDLQMREAPLTEAARQACAGPSWRTPVRGLDWHWPPDALLGWWLASLVVALIAAASIASAAQRRPPS